MSNPVQDQDKIDRLQKALGDVYTVVNRIGGGGMGDVYMATHKTLGGKWAIKLLAEDLARDAVLVERFINEAKIEANLQHPNIVKVFDIGQKDQFHYLVMSFVEGEDLDERLRDNRKANVPMDVREAIGIGMQVIKALECAHDNNIIHRDLKPSNVRIDRYGTVIVMDFGIARVRQAGLQGKTVLGERLGTPLYMSPEQAAGRPVDLRSDLYSLGVIFYEMIAGANPYEAENPFAICLKHLQYDPPPLTEVRPEVSQEVSDVVQKLLDKEPDNRYQTAAEIREALAAFSGGTEIRSAPRTIAAAPMPEHLRVLGPLEAVLHQIPDVDTASSLTKPQLHLLTVIDGIRTVREILKASELGEQEAAEAIEALKSQGVVYSEIPLGADDSDPPAPKVIPRTTSRSISPFSQTPAPKVATPAPAAAMPEAPAPEVPANVKKRGISVWVIGGVIAAVVVIGIVALLMRPKAEVRLSAVKVDASPFATVTVKSEKGEKILTDDTPFTVSLAPGLYTFDFESAGQPARQIKKQIALDASDVVRADFWTPEETRRLVESYIQ